MATQLRSQEHDIGDRFPSLSRGARFATWLTISIALVTAICSAAVAFAKQPLDIQVISSRPDMVVGGDALVRIPQDQADKGEPVKVLLNGTDVTGRFRRDPADGTLLGRVDGLTLGENRLQVKRAGRRTTVLKLVNHPIAGPVFSGPHQTPFICRTAGAGLGAPLDADCTAATRSFYIYKSMQNPPVRDGDPVVPLGFRIFDPAVPRPNDMARTITSAGAEIDYVVRVERGTINRAIYQIAFLHQPGQPLPDPWTRANGWNGRLVYVFGGGCRAGYNQGMLSWPGFFAGTDSLIGDQLLAKGYAVATSTFNVFMNNCNFPLSAETAMMVKEHFVERFGTPVHTIGLGASGGSMQQLLIAENYPGVLDGIIPSQTFADLATLVPTAVDCSLLDRAFRNGKSAWTDDQKTAVAGFASWGGCAGKAGWGNSWSKLWVQARPVGNCDGSVPKSLLYDPANNRRGARCDLFDNEVNVFGRDADGFARRPLDNVGVQYGLKAFNAGVIAPEQFVELNELVGGNDREGDLVRARSQADPLALRRAYAAGTVVSGRGGLAVTPIIDFRDYADSFDDIHDSVRSFILRERLKVANGDADNHVMWTIARRSIGSVGKRLNLMAVQKMDEWLDRIAADAASGGAREKMRRNKPVDLVDGCWSGEGTRIDDPRSHGGSGRCDSLYPPHGDPRLAAGAPLANLSLKCSLKPFDPRDYAQPLTSDQVARLRIVFARGVCDYRRAGPEQRRSPVSWPRL